MAKRQLSFVPESRTCEWCDEPIPEAARADSVTCSQECRQSRHRFRISPATKTADEPMRFFYCDPPYPGLAHYYKDQPTYGGEVDHRELVARLVAEAPDGWALSTSARSLQFVLALCPPDVRVAAWVKGSRAGASNRARSAWEPVIIRGGRPLRLTSSEVLDDVLSWGGRQPSHPGAIIGMKPAPFCEWVFRQLGAMRRDQLVDLFPGSGAVGRAWRIYSGQPISVSVGDPWNPPRLVEREGSTLPSRLEESRSK